VSPLRGEKNKNRLVSKNNTGRLALRTSPVVNYEQFTSMGAFSAEFSMTLAAKLLMGPKKIWLVK